MIKGCSARNTECCKGHFKETEILEIPSKQKISENRSLEGSISGVYRITRKNNLIILQVYLNIRRKYNLRVKHNKDGPAHKERIEFKIGHLPMIAAPMVQ